MADSSLEQVKSNQVDLEKIPVEDVFTILNCTREGLTDDEATKRLDIFGYNKLEEKTVRCLPLLFVTVSYIFICFKTKYRLFSTSVLRNEMKIYFISS